MTGIVVSNSDPDRSSRIKVSFPSLPGADTSSWAPIVAIGGGPERGWFFLPEAGDEVLVAFLDGDPERPVVLSSFWSDGVLPTKPGAPAVPGGTPDWAGREVRRGIRHSIESGHDFLVVTGVVVEQRGAKESSMVKLKFPWLPGHDPDEHVWARVVQTSGAGRGTFFLPEEGQEVAVAFLHGDLRQPVVLGALWGNDLPPVEEVVPGAPRGEESSPGVELPRGEGWCCHQGEIFVAPERDCRDLGGEFFASPDEAERACLGVVLGGSPPAPSFWRAESEQARGLATPASLEPSV